MYVSFVYSGIQSNQFFCDIIHIGIYNLLNYQSVVTQQIQIHLTLYNSL